MEEKNEEQNEEKPKRMIEIFVNDRIGKRIRIKCFPNDTILTIKKLVAAHCGTRPEKIILQMANKIYKDKLTLEDYEIGDGSGLELYYN